MKVLVIDIGGTTVKFFASGHEVQYRVPTGPGTTPDHVVGHVKERTHGWNYDAISIGYPAVVRHGSIVSEPRNLGTGWVGFDFEKAFGVPVRIVNDAAMQALGSYKVGLMFFLGVGTGLGSAIIAHDTIVSMELGYLAYEDKTYEDYLGERGLQDLGQEDWWKHVSHLIQRIFMAVHPDELVLGGGNNRHVNELPPRCRLGSNADAFTGGFRLWEKQYERTFGFYA
jgi:predicted NBD/HSP70 family sugar kinase